MKVDFNQDEFGEFWLMNVDNLFVRKLRNVPSDNGTQLADYVLIRMQEMEKLEAQNKRKQAKKDAKLMQDSDSDLGNENNNLRSFDKRTKSMTQYNSRTKLRRVGTSNEELMQGEDGEAPVSSHTLFRKNHPQYFGQQLL